MSHYTRRYSGLSRAEADNQAIEDMKDFLSDKQWQTVVAMLEEGADIEPVNFGLGIAGVSGYPFHALCRRYALERYRAWRAEGEDGVATDAEGFAEGEGLS